MNKEKAGINASSLITALLTAVLVLAGTWLLAERLEHSRLYTQGKILRSIAAQDQVNLLSVLTDENKRDAMTLFIGAITTAYLNFELIPYSEGQTFAAVLQSLNGGIHVEQFEYRRRDLLIRGNADSPESYDEFSFLLSHTGHFSSVTGHKYLTVDDTIRFEIWCVAHQNTVPALL